MATKMGMRKTTDKTAKKNKPSLKSINGLKKLSPKAQREMSEWMKTKRERIRRLTLKFGYLPCEFCEKKIVASADCHHLNRRRSDNSLPNSRILHRICHGFVHDHNIKEIKSLLEEEK